MTARVRLGQLLVSAKLISQAELDEVLGVQRREGRRLGTLLVEGGFVSEAHVTQILSQQLSVPWVSLHHIDFSQQLLAKVDADLAERLCLIPIYMRKVRGLGDVLYVAMDDPSNQSAVDEIARHTGLPIRAMIAPPSDIRAALYLNYGIGQPPPKPKRHAKRRPSLVEAERELPTAPSGLDVPEELTTADVVTLPPGRELT